MTERIDLQEFLGAFVVEAEELVAAATTSLLEIETAIGGGTSRPRAVRDLFRALHTIKGLASMIGVESIVEIAHALERLVRAADRAGGTLHRGGVEIALHAIGAIAARVRAVADHRAVAEVPEGPEGLIEQIASAEPGIVAAIPTVAASLAAVAASVEQVAATTEKMVVDGNAVAIEELARSAQAVVLSGHQTQATQNLARAAGELRTMGKQTRDETGGQARAFDDDDLATIETCIEYASLAVENAVRFDAERSAERAINAERERIARSQHEMLRIVGHDLRGPLGAILVGTEMLAAEFKDAPAGAYVVKRIESCANRMTRMVDQLLDMTRARLGHGIPVLRTRTQLLPLINSVMAELSLAHTGTRFELVAAAEVVGQWDPDRLGQVLSNLLSNAVYYGLAGAPIHIGVAGADGAATITIHNQLRGQPISSESLATLFEPYRRRGDHEPNGNGLGFGLYIVSEIVRAHGGMIDVASSPSGTTFRVVLPEEGQLAELVR